MYVFMFLCEKIVPVDTLLANSHITLSYLLATIVTCNSGSNMMVPDAVFTPTTHLNNMLSNHCFPRRMFFRLLCVENQNGLGVLIQDTKSIPKQEKTINETMNPFLPSAHKQNLAIS
jgi:hypothetical protein